MKLVKKWLFPLLTCLVVVGSVALPRRISEARDAKQLRQIHTEELAEDLPVYDPPTLLDRLELYTRWCTPSETIPSFQSPVILYDEDSGQSENLARQALDRLAQAEVIPSHLLSSTLTITSMDRILLWDPAVSVGRQEPMEFWAVMADLGDGSLWMRLDGESGLPITLSLYDPNMARWLSYKDPQALPSLTEHYFALLDLEAAEVGASGDTALWERQYSVGDTGITYCVSFNATMLNIQPGRDTTDPVTGFDRSTQLY